MRLTKVSTSALGPLRLLLAASVALPVMLFVFTSWLNYRSTLAEALRDLQRSCEVAREQAAKVLDAQGQVSERVNDLVRDMDEAQIRAAEKRLHEALAAIVAHLPQIQTVLLTSASGHPLVSAGVYPVRHDIDLTGRDYFQAVIGGYDGTFVSTVQMGDVNRQLFFGLARPAFDAGGKISGVIDIAVSPGFFRDFYKVLVGEGGNDAGKVLTLVREDGQILVRYPDLAGPPPRLLQTNQFFTAVHDSPDNGIYINRSNVDDGAPERIFVYRKVPGYPLYVVAGRSHASIIAVWQRNVGRQLIFVIPAALALFAVTWTALRRARREQEALAWAHQEMARRELAENQLLRAQRLEAVGQMTGGVAHDFNNLLTIIVGNVEMIDRRAEDTARVRRLAANVLLAARRGAEVTQQLLAFSRRQMVKPETVDLNRRLREFRQLLERAARDTVRVEFDLGADLAPVNLDPGQFEAAILNLVGNARDAMPDGGKVVIATRNVTLRAGERPELAPGDYVRVTVVDAGTGMDAATAAKAFEPFFTTKEVGRGTGLGLSQVYGFARQAGGDADIVTAPGEGTTVMLILPRTYEPAAAPAEDSNQSAVQQVRHGEVVLVVEDEPGVLEMAVETLQELGYTTLSACNAHAALERLRQHDRVDVLFSDVVMPGGMDGVQLSLAAKRLRPALKVLLTSGYAAASMVGALPPEFRLLNKPYDRSELTRHLHAVINGT